MLSVGSCLIPVAVVGPPEGLFPARDAFDCGGLSVCFLRFSRVVLKETAIHRWIFLRDELVSDMLVYLNSVCFGIRGSQ